MTEEQILYAGDFLQVKRRGRWEFVVRANARAAVVLIPVTPANELVLVQQPRIPTGKSVIELPAGLVGDIAGQEDESFARAAARELEEETGFHAGELLFATAGPPSPGLSSEHTVFYLARSLRKVGAGGGDESEQIIVHVVPLAEIHQWLAACAAEGLLVDPKVYAGLYFVEHADELL